MDKDVFGKIEWVLVRMTLLALLMVGIVKVLVVEFNSLMKLHPLW